MPPPPPVFDQKNPPSSPDVKTDIVKPDPKPDKPVVKTPPPVVPPAERAGAAFANNSNGMANPAKASILIVNLTVCSVSYLAPEGPGGKKGYRCQGGRVTRDNCREIRDDSAII